MTVQQSLKAIADPQKATLLQRFFKTGKGEYAEGDIFIGVVVSQSRKIAKQFVDLSFEEITKLLTSPIHEERLTALFILIAQFEKGDEKRKKEIFDLYLSHTTYINNWDLVDLSAPHIVGEYLFCHPEFISGSKNKKMLNQVQHDSIEILTTLAKSKNLWERRIAILATFFYIKEKKSEPAFTIAKILLNDSHDLIHKAVGWMLREMGKRISQETEESFLKKYYKEMPRTMLRYAIERFPEKRRKLYLEGKV